MLFPNFVAVFTAFAVTGASAQKCKCKSNPCTKNLVQNGGFDDPLTGAPWIFTGTKLTNTKPRSPPQAALSQIQSEVDRDSIQQSVTLVDGKTYALRYYWAIVGGTFDATAGCQISSSIDTTRNENYILPNTQQGQYNLHEWTFTAPPASSTLKITVSCPAGDTTLDINMDDISLYPASCLTPT